MLWPSLSHSTIERGCTHRLERFLDFLLDLTEALSGIVQRVSLCNDTLKDAKPTRVACCTYFPQYCPVVLIWHFALFGQWQWHSTELGGTVRSLFNSDWQATVNHCRAARARPSGRSGRRSSDDVLNG
jgi:hypothetical protein